MGDQTGNRYSHYELLYTCYLSGQISDRQWQQHLTENEVFRKWVETRTGRMTSQRKPC